MLFDACVPSRTHNSTVRVACTLVTLLAMGCGLYRKASWPDIGRTSVDVQLAGNQTRALDRAGTVTCWTSDLTAHAVALPAPAINFSLHDPVSCAVLRD